MKEHAVTFGRNDDIVGVLTSPDAARKAPHVLILNAGFVHHVGPARLTVEVARHLASAGFSTLRFDLSGIGDSAERIPRLDVIGCGIADVRDAMDHLCAVHGAREFVLFGLCSGARHAHHVAMADARVVAAILLDGPAYATKRYLAMRLRQRFDHPLDLLAGMARRALRWMRATRPTTRIEPDDGETFFPASPTREQMAKDLHMLAARNVALLYINSGEWQDYSYRGQLREAFKEVPLGPLLTEHRIASADHLYFTQPERTLLLDTVRSWLQERFEPTFDMTSMP